MLTIHAMGIHRKRFDYNQEKENENQKAGHCKIYNDFLPKHLDAALCQVFPYVVRGLRSFLQLEFLTQQCKCFAWLVILRVTCKSIGGDQLVKASLLTLLVVKYDEGHHWSGEFLLFVLHNLFYLFWVSLVLLDVTRDQISTSLKKEIDDLLVVIGKVNGCNFNLVMGMWVVQSMQMTLIKTLSNVFYLILKFFGKILLKGQLLLQLLPGLIPLLPCFFGNLQLHCEICCGYGLNIPVFWVHVRRFLEVV